jgi:hypothetical protein
MKRSLAAGAMMFVVVAAGVGLSSASGPGVAQPAPAPPRTLDDTYAQMARDVPGFAGLQLAEDGETIQVFFRGTESQPGQALERAVTAFLEANGEPWSGTIELLPARYDFLQLRGWYDRLVVLNLPGLVMTDIDEVNNRLFIGVETAEARDLVEQRLVELDIPREVVAIEIMEPIVPLGRRAG